MSCTGIFLVEWVWEDCQMGKPEHTAHVFSTFLITEKRILGVFMR
jgi:hypothetical protein